MLVIKCYSPWTTRHTFLSLTLHSHLGSSLPLPTPLQVFFIRDGMKFPDLVHAFKPSPKDNQQKVRQAATLLRRRPTA